MDARAFHFPGVFAFFAELKDCFYRIAGIRQSTIPRDLAYDSCTRHHARAGRVGLPDARCQISFLAAEARRRRRPVDLLANWPPCFAAHPGSRRIANATATRSNLNVIRYPAARSGFRAPPVFDRELQVVARTHRQQEMIFDIEHPGDRLGPLEHDAELHEIVGEIARMVLWRMPAMR